MVKGRQIITIELITHENGDKRTLFSSNGLRSYEQIGLLYQAITRVSNKSTEREEEQQKQEQKQEQEQLKIQKKK